MVLDIQDRFLDHVVLRLNSMEVTALGLAIVVAVLLLHDGVHPTQKVCIGMKQKIVIQATGLNHSPEMKSLNSMLFNNV